MTGSNLTSNFYARKSQILRAAFLYFKNSLKLTAFFGIELEFYLLEQNGLAVENQVLIDDFILQFDEFFLQKYKIEKEQGKSQIEIKLAYKSELDELCLEVEKIKNAAKDLAKKNNLIASFQSQPFLDDCGSALQFNFSLHDENNKNLFCENDELMNFAIGGMLEFIDEMMIFCAPCEEDYSRFDLEINRKLHKKGKYTAPVNICFGENNRTALIRIVRLKNSPNNARLEFRAASADADSWLVLASLLRAIEYGVKNKIIPENSKKIFGNAFDAQYDLEKLPTNLNEVQEIFVKKNRLRDWFENERVG